MKLEFEYGQGLVGAELPDSTDIFIPGETVADPPCLPQDWDSLYAATLASIRNPIGMPPLKELAGPGKSVVIVIPDIVKGGNQPTSHRKVAIRACLDELYAASEQFAEKAHANDMEQERLRTECAELDAKCNEENSAVAVLRTGIEHNRASIERVENDQRDQSGRAESLTAQIAAKHARIEELAAQTAENWISSVSR